MQRLLCWVGCVLCAASIMLGSSLPAQAKCSCAANEVVNCGHRGTGKSKAGDPFPENTIPSFEQAVIEGATQVELDVVHSKDGVLVVIHDDKVDRTTNGSGCAGDMTVAELQMLDAAAGTQLEDSGVKIPTLEEVLAAIDVDVNIEIKINDTSGCPASDKPQLAADAAAAVQADGKSRSVVISSFDMDVLDEVEKLSTAIYTGYITLLKTKVQEVKDHGLDAINLMGGLADELTIDEAHELGLEINVWTVNDPALMATLLDNGVDSVITDDPDVFAQAKDDWCAEHAGGCDDTVEESSGCSLSPAPRQPSSGGWLLFAAGAWLLARRRRRGQ